jgi:hypothetical protein
LEAVEGRRAYAKRPASASLDRGQRFAAILWRFSRPAGRQLPEFLKIFAPKMFYFQFTVS